jgi:glycosidase
MLERARARGIRNFHIFGEVMEFEPEVLAHYTRVDKFPAVNDFALQSAIVDVIAKRAAPDRLARVFEADARYSGGEATARRLVTLVSNHDVKRIGRAIRSGNPEAGEDEILKRAVLANAILLHARGVPALYYGDEQGFIGDGDIDQDSREDMFATQVSSYRDDRLIGGGQRTGQSHFDDRHPLFRAIAEMARRRAQDPALRRGRQITRLAAGAPGLFAFSRLLAGSGETLVVINASTSGQTAVVRVEGSSRNWESMHGSCAQSAGTEGYAIRVPPLDYVVCKSREPAGG